MHIIIIIIIIIISIIKIFTHSNKMKYLGGKYINSQEYTFYLTLILTFIVIRMAMAVTHLAIFPANAPLGVTLRSTMTFCEPLTSGSRMKGCNFTERQHILFNLTLLYQYAIAFQKLVSGIICVNYSILGADLVQAPWVHSKNNSWHIPTVQELTYRQQNRITCFKGIKLFRSCSQHFIPTSFLANCCIFPSNTD